jgi:hypothetical protein
VIKIRESEPEAKTQLGIEKTELIDDLVIYPNPNDGQFSAEISLQDRSEVILQIYSIQGHKLMQTQLEGLDRYRVHVRGVDLPRGHYILRVIAGEDHRVEQFIVY